MKVLNNRLLKVANKLLGPSQTAFILSRYIMEGVVILHEQSMSCIEKTRWCDFKIRF